MEGHSVDLLVDVHIGSNASCVAWCPVNGVVAVGARVSPDLACVHLLNVHCINRKVTLYVPLAGPSDGLACVAWSPAGCRRVLLTATLSGKLTAWTQQPPDLASQQHITLEDWWSHDIADLSALSHIPTPETASGATPAADGITTDNIVAVSWLQPAPSWVWSSSAVQQADFKAGSVHDMFCPQPSRPAKAEDAAEPSRVAGSGEFHWVRPGTLALAAVLSSGAVVLCWARWAAYGTLQWSTSSMRLPAGAAVQAADATVCGEGVAVCYRLQAEPTTIRVAHLQGSPVHMQCAFMTPGEAQQQVCLPVAPIAVHCQAQGGSITALSWDPNSSGSRLLSIAQCSSGSSMNDTQGPGSASGLLNLYSVHKDQQQLVHEGQVGCASAPQQQQQLAWLLDGLLMVSGGQQLQLYQTDPLQQVEATFTQPGSRTAGSRRVLQSLAASPHGVAVAALLGCEVRGGNSSSRLVVYNVPAIKPCSSGPSGAAASRLLWALMQQKHNWDVVQHVLCFVRQARSGSSSSTDDNTAAAAQAAAVGEALSLVDSKVAVQQATLKSPYSARWDVLKLAVLSSTPGSVAACVSIDLRLRILSLTLKPIFDVIREETAMRSRDPRPKAFGGGPLLTYLSDVMAFHIACLKTWLSRRASGSASAQLVPCIRHFLDWRPCNLLMLLYMMTCQAVNPSAKDDPLYPALKAAWKAAPPCKDPNWEQTARAMFPGNLQLHYGDVIPDCISSLNLPPEQLMRHMESFPAWQQQAPLSDAEITAAAVRLGLLPVTSPTAAGLYKRELQLHSGFRLAPQQQADMPPSALEAAAAAPSAAALRPGSNGSVRLVSMKRRRWEQQLGDAMGDGPGSAASSIVMDLAHMQELDTGTPGCVQSVDGAVLAHEVPQQGGEDGSSKHVAKVLTDQCMHGWVYSCPITGEMWMRRAS